MRLIQTCLLAIILAPLANAQQSLYELNFPSSAHPFPTDQSSPRVNPGIATGSSSGLYMRFGEDIAKLCANYGISLTSQDPNRLRFPKFRVNVYATQGGFDSVKRLRYEREVQLAIVQSDLRYFADERAKDEFDPKKQEAWRQIADEIKLVLPLFKEKVHILVRPEDKERFKDMAGLMKAGAVVNVGQISSGGMLTCAMIQEIIEESRDWRNNGNRMWKKRYHPQDAALDMLTGNNTTDKIDAVILVGGVPYPALKNYGMDFAVKKGLFRADVKPKAPMTLLPIGDEALDILTGSAFKGYHPETIKMSEYDFLGESKEVIKTIGVYANLVTHSAYTDSSRESHKIEWVRHILFRILTKLDPYSDYGLPFDFGVPRVGDKWKQVVPEGDLSSESSWEELYGWPRHADPIIREMMDVWAKGKSGGGGGTGGSVIDPITLF